MRLPSSLRLKHARDFARVKAEGSSQAGKYVVLGVAKAENEPEFRYGLVTGRKLGNAVVRNRIRRLLREVIRAHRAEIAPGWHLVVIGRWKAPQATLAEIEHDWLRLAKRLGILQMTPLAVLAA
ncbi:MAG: ribonuclease P protein component [Verrucomicrobiaceae bacterium]|jgi:ribonuclease P protein component|nr:ribonuclease P protein component [Verrucomicrobiaceae bacterium]